MNLYRNKVNKKLYTIEYIIRDCKHLNNNAFAGIYCYPYVHNSDVIVFQSKNKSECNVFVDDNFEVVSEI